MSSPIKSFIRENIKYKIESLFEYYIFIETNIGNELKGIQDKFEKAQFDYSEYKISNPSFEEDSENYFDSHFDDLSYDHQRISNNILLKHRNSLIFLIYSFLEEELLSYCKFNHEANVFSINDLKGNSVFEKFKLFISKTDKNIYEKLNPEIIYFDRLRILRNVITHHANYIKSDNSNLKRIQEFSKNRFELVELSNPRILKNKDTTFFIKLNDKSIINETFDNLNIFFNKLYLLH